MCSLWPWISTNQLATCCSTCCVTVRPLMRPTVRPEAKISRERIRCPSSGVISYVCKSVARAKRASALSASEWFVTVCCVSKYVNITLVGFTISACTHFFYADFSTEQRTHRIDDDRFTRARFTCKYIEQAVKAQVQGINNCKVFDVQLK